MIIVIAPNYAQGMYWCRKRNDPPLGPRDIVLCTGLDDHRLNGLRVRPGDRVVWYNVGGMGWQQRCAVRDLIRQILIPCEPEVKVEYLD